MHCGHETPLPRHASDRAEHAFHVRLHRPTLVRRRRNGLAQCMFVVYARHLCHPERAVRLHLDGTERLHDRGEANVLELRVELRGVELDGARRAQSRLLGELLEPRLVGRLLEHLERVRADGHAGGKEMLAGRQRAQRALHRRQHGGDAEAFRRVGRSLHVGVRFGERVGEPHDAGGRVRMCRRLVAARAADVRLVPTGTQAARCREAAVALVHEQENAPGHRGSIIPP